MTRIKLFNESSYAGQPVRDLYDVILYEAELNKLCTVKILKELTGLGLKEAKDLFDHRPCVIFSEIDLDDANAIKENFYICQAKIIIVKSFSYDPTDLSTIFKPDDDSQFEDGYDDDINEEYNSDKNEFEIGDRVKINPKSKYRNQGGGKLGTIRTNNYDYMERFKYNVVWDSGDKKNYNDEDLILVDKGYDFLVNDKVKLKKTSKYYGRNYNQLPIDVIGTICRIGNMSDHPYKVEWFIDGKTYKNSYNYEDLEPIKDDDDSQFEEGFELDEKINIKKMDKLNVMDIGSDVIVNGEYNGFYFHNKIGKIISKSNDEFGIEFKEKITFGHTCDKIGKKGHCFYVGKNIVKSL